MTADDAVLALNRIAEQLERIALVLEALQAFAGEAIQEAGTIEAAGE